MAAMRYKDKDTGVVLSFGGHLVSWSHTVVAYRTSYSKEEIASDSIR